MPSDDLRPVSADVFSKREAILLAAAAGAVVATLTVLLSRMTLDDAYITFRYARHLAEGYGLGAWNRTGEHVEGYSSPLWMLLIAGAAWLGVDLRIASKVFGAAAALTVITVLIRRRADRPAVLAGIFLPLYLPFMLYTASGMEAVGFTCLAAAALCILSVAVLGTFLALRELGGRRHDDIPRAQNRVARRKTRRRAVLVRR